MILLLHVLVLSSITTKVNVSTSYSLTLYIFFNFQVICAKTCKYNLHTNLPLYCVDFFSPAEKGFCVKSWPMEKTMDCGDLLEYPYTYWPQIHLISRYHHGTALDVEQSLAIDNNKYKHKLAFCTLSYLVLPFVILVN